ncbi:DUF4783 domain-containing protein [Sphingobacterium hungaricum]|uniref:DUF4783 domain-containing protein n=1 Tax=Sphingobacterium hungaricum TaxID=2082723 RepID=A0A928UXF1_9SPHI|nr:DUF4783 domain-containing protein [Sphingobacterium hungaricum]MBE8715051.1 hypothetical protein [Sphingobacterium hungaricum]
MLIVQFILFSLTGYSLGYPFQSDISAQIYQSFRAGNAKELVKSFSDNISLTINKDENYYTKFQSEVTLADFFRANNVTSVKEIQKKLSASNNSYLVYELKTSNKTFRVFIRVVESNKQYKISELRIE